MLELDISEACPKTYLREKAASFSSAISTNIIQVFEATEWGLVNDLNQKFQFSADHPEERLLTIVRKSNLLGNLMCPNFRNTGYEIRKLSPK
jgi:hypothetical protein